MNVKFFAAAALVATLATTTIQAQSTYKMGFTLGSNYSSLSSDLFTTASGRLSAAAGFTISLGFGDRFDLSPEIMFVQKGASAKVVNFQPENEPVEGTYNFYYNTFEAGVLGGFKPVASLPFRIQAGGFFGSHFHNLDRKQKDLYVGDYKDVNEATKVVDLNEAFTGVDFGPAFGISAGEGRFRVAARYYLGMRNLNNNRDFVEKSNRITTNSMRLSVTYFFKQ
ncbi:MAG: PorT family protein [Saprospiraceae bacterium]|nr:PorT family protein [Saprospiraceae bacterium]